MMTQIEREERGLEESYQNGDITLKEYNREMAELQRDYRDQAQEASQQAYDDEMDRW